MRNHYTYIIHLSIYCLLNSFSSFSQQIDSLYIKKTIAELNELEIPQHLLKEDSIVRHFAYRLAYDEKHEQASWVAYTLNKNKTTANHQRTNRFLEDSKIIHKSANDDDYKKSGYDRGHLAPAADMAWDSTAMKESFYYSNISPQTPGFNRGIWKKLEELVRSWTNQNEQLFIVTGPILNESLPTIGQNKVSVPKAYYKIILAYNQSYLKVIGFIIPNQASKTPLKNFTFSVDEIEKQTQINFFHQLPDNIENKLEKSLCIECWQWK